MYDKSQCSVIHDISGSVGLASTSFLDSMREEKAYIFLLTLGQSLGSEGKNKYKVTLNNPNRYSRNLTQSKKKKKAIF